MYNDSNYSLYYPYYRMEPMNSYIRVLHASPNAPAVDVYANDKLIVRNLAYRDFSPYITVASGNYTIRVYPAGKKESPVIDSKFYIPPKSIFTLAAAGELANIELVAIPEPLVRVPDNKVYVRFAHLSPDAPSVDIALADGKILFRNVKFKEFTEYITVDHGKYTFDVRPAGTEKSVLHVPNVHLRPGKIYTIYAVGFAGRKPSLQVLIPLDGNSYLKF